MLNTTEMAKVKQDNFESAEETYNFLRKPAFFKLNISYAYNNLQISPVARYRKVTARAFQFAIRIYSIRFVMRIDSNRFV